jgi:hypothetical protein
MSMLAMFNAILAEEGMNPILRGALIGAAVGGVVGLIMALIKKKK